MTRQEMFDKGMQGVLSQNGYAYNYNHQVKLNSCSYFEDGKRCMVGWLAKDGDMAKGWQRENLGPIAVGEKLGLSYDDSNFLDSLQSAHDEVADLSDYCFERRSFIERMRNFAESYKLEFNYAY